MSKSLDQDQVGCIVGPDLVQTTCICKVYQQTTLVDQKLVFCYIPLASSISEIGNSDKLMYRQN